MVLKNPYQTYQKQAVSTFTPEDLTYRLYQGLVKYIRLSKAGLETSNLNDCHQYNLRAQDILSELMVTLKEGYEISMPLLSMYDYMKRRLIEANLTKQMDILTEVEAYAVELAETWSAAMKLSKVGQ